MDFKKYQELYSQSINNPDSFWADQAGRLKWQKTWTKVKDTSFQKPVSIKWFQGGKLNVSENCLDRHLEKNGDKVAIIWEADSPEVAGNCLTCRSGSGGKKNNLQRIALRCLPNGERNESPRRKER